MFKIKQTTGHVSYARTYGEALTYLADIYGAGIEAEVDPNGDPEDLYNLILVWSGFKLIATLKPLAFDAGAFDGPALDRLSAAVAGTLTGGDRSLFPLDLAF